MHTATAKHRDYSHPTDTELVALVRGGDGSAFREIMRRYNQRLYRAIEQGDTRVIMFPGVQASPSPEVAAARAEVRRLLEAAIDELPESFRLVFMMRDVEEMSIEETATSLDIRPETVKTRLHRARRLLRKNLDARLSTVLRDTFPFQGARCARITGAVMARLGLESA